MLRKPDIDCIVRELEEETSLASSRIEKVQDFHSCVGYSSEMIELFIAYDCYKIENPRSGDDDEFIEVHEFSREEVELLIKEGKITDSKTLALLLHYLHFNK